MKNGEWENEMGNKKLEIVLIFFLTIYNAEHVFFNSHYWYPCPLSKTFRGKFEKCNKLMIRKEVTLSCFVVTIWNLTSNENDFYNNFD